MKITAFNPLIVSPKAEELVALFEEMGFEKRHQKSGIDEGKVESIDMRHEGGFTIDVASADPNLVPKDILAIRVNVDDFDGARAFLKEKGFVNVRDDDYAEDTGSSKATLMYSPSGFAISLCQHIKD